MAPGAAAVMRDLATDPVLHIAAETILGHCMPPEAMTDALRVMTATSDEPVNEVKGTDGWRWSMPGAAPVLTRAAWLVMGPRWPGPHPSPVTPPWPGRSRHPML